MKLTKISLSFNKRGIQGLKEISLTINPGQIMCLVGPNGAGKTTLLKVMSGETAFESGAREVLPSQKILLDLSRETLKDINLTTEEFLLSKITLDIDDEKKEQLTRDLALSFEFTSELFQNLSSLSQGQKDRVHLSSVLINQPDLLLLDEPFSHLDETDRFVLFKQLFDYTKSLGLSVVWATHDLRNAMSFSDELVVMQFGKILQQGNPLQVFTHPSSYFVASFLGHKNLLTLKQKNETTWITAWGELKKNWPAHEHILISLPSHAFQINARGAYQGEIQKTFIQGETAVLELLSQGILLKLTIPLHNIPVSNGPALAFDIIWEKAILIGPI